MKKFMTMLVLVVLIAGFVFASDSSFIQIKSVISASSPVIELKYTSSSGADGKVIRAEDITSTTNDNPIDVGFSINKGGKVVFQAFLSNYTKSTDRYSIAFIGGTFNEVMRRGDIGTRSPNSIVTNVVSSSSEVSGIGSISLGDPTGVGGEDNKAVLVQFDGVLDRSVTLPLPLATAEYVYPEDKTIDSGTYYADVTLLVTSEK